MTCGFIKGKAELLPRTSSHVTRRWNQFRSPERGAKVHIPLWYSTFWKKRDDISHLPQIKWGIEHEKDAIKSFLSDAASKHGNGMNGFKQCGLFIKPDYTFLAASPDGLFVCLWLLQSSYTWSEMTFLSQRRKHQSESYLQTHRFFGGSRWEP